MTDFHAIARDATDELRRQQCRHGPHEMTPAEMLRCPRCGPVLRFDLNNSAAQAASVRQESGAGISGNIPVSPSGEVLAAANHGDKLPHQGGPAPAVETAGRRYITIRDEDT